MPRVSIIMASYQHRPFVAAAIHSVLRQTYQDFEIVVTDDGSVDGTPDVIASIQDPRIKLRRFETNRGACSAGNDALNRATGEYISNLSSDDVYLPHKLEKQVAYLDAHPEIGAVFAYPIFINEDGAVIENQISTFNHKVFLAPNRSQVDWLRHFFFVGNCLCHPTILIRRRCYEELGVYDERLAQLPDFDMWIRLLAAYPIHIMAEPMIGFRILNNNGNVSAPKAQNIVRVAWETTRVLRQYARLPGDLFAAVFSPELEALNINKSVNPAIALGRICMATNITHLHSLGLELLYNALPPQSEEHSPSGITYREYLNYTGNSDIYNTLIKEKFQALENTLHNIIAMSPLDTKKIPQ
ncbi:glycosyltransferase [Gluconacetobacter takamatsuzukensis]|uniref:Glycosyltransferase n=1 Tax=Gluconacetobacter takamatsuzukensis TaxID=1286190 RepID=A0A7W4PP03_9PROT|nr:glycosyltransferase [Gluconacetobacter takamatsuzukensis]MBB2205162.1 glycosyltransferase [Gluconacetobacter takamatsuzukensis]